MASYPGTESHLTSSCDHGIFTADVISMALCAFLVFTQTDSKKIFSASRDFLGGGGLAKFSRLAAGVRYYFDPRVRSTRRVHLTRRWNDRESLQNDVKLTGGSLCH